MTVQRILFNHIKTAPKETINYLTLDGIKLLLEGPDTSTPRGRRDLTLLSLLYYSGARVQEIIDIVQSMIKLNAPNTVKLIGKGSKVRIVSMAT